MNIPKVVKRRIKIPKQKSFMWLGAFMDSMYMSLPMVSIINFISIQTVLYANVILPAVPWLPFPLFILFMILLVLCVMIIAFKFVIPSLWVWRGKQLYGHQSILMDKVEQTRQEVAEVKRETKAEICFLGERMEHEFSSLREELETLKDEIKGGTLAP